MTRFRALTNATRAAFLAALLLTACTGAPEMPPGAISSEAAQKIILERDDARDKAAARERELLAEIEQLRAEVRELRSSQGLRAVERIAPPAPIARPAPAPEQATAMAVEMTNLSARPIETNDSWTRFSWQGVVQNNLDRPITVKAVVLFLDSSGFELESVDTRITLQPGEFRKISGVELINHQVAPRVATVGGRIEP